MSYDESDLLKSDREESDILKDRDEYYNEDLYIGSYPVSEVYLNINEYKDPIYSFQDLWPELRDEAQKDNYQLYKDKYCDSNISIEQLQEIAEIDGYYRYSYEYSLRIKSAKEDFYARYNDDIEQMMVASLLKKAISDRFHKYSDLGSRGNVRVLYSSVYDETNDYDNKSEKRIRYDEARRDEFRRYQKRIIEEDIQRLRKIALEDSYRRYSYNYLLCEEIAMQDGYSKYLDVEGVDISVSELEKLAKSDCYKKYYCDNKELSIEQRKERAEMDDYHRYQENLSDSKRTELMGVAHRDDCLRYARNYYELRKAAMKDGFARYKYDSEGKELSTIAEQDHYSRYYKGYEIMMNAAIEDGLKRYLEINTYLDCKENKEKAFKDEYKRYDSVIYAARIRAELDHYSKYKCYRDISQAELVSVAMSDSYLRYIEPYLEELAISDHFARYLGIIENENLIPSEELKKKARNLALTDHFQKYMDLLRVLYYDKEELNICEFDKRMTNAANDLYNRYTCNCKGLMKLTEEEAFAERKRIAEEDNFSKYRLYISIDWVKKEDNPFRTEMYDYGAK